MGLVLEAQPNYLLGMGLVLEAQIPENIANQMEEVLVNHWNLPDNSSLGRVSVIKEAGSHKINRYSNK
jgi:hypothetical protein